MTTTRTPLLRTVALTCLTVFGLAAGMPLELLAKPVPAPTAVAVAGISCPAAMSSMVVPAVQVQNDTQKKGWRCFSAIAQAAGVCGAAIGNILTPDPVPGVDEYMFAGACLRAAAAAYTICDRKVPRWIIRLLEMMYPS